MLSMKTPDRVESIWNPGPGSCPAFTSNVCENTVREDSRVQMPAEAGQAREWLKQKYVRKRVMVKAVVG